MILNTLFSQILQTALLVYIYIYTYIEGEREREKEGEREKEKRSLQGIMAIVLDCGLKVSEFKFHLYYKIHIWTNTLGKSMNPLIFPAIG